MLHCLPHLLLLLLLLEAYNFPVQRLSFKCVLFRLFRQVVGLFAFQHIFQKILCLSQARIVTESNGHIAQSNNLGHETTKGRRNFLFGIAHQWSLGRQWQSRCQFGRRGRQVLRQHINAMSNLLAGLIFFFGGLRGP